MVLVSSAILGAATGTGLALGVAMTVVVYRYYVYKRKGKEWAELEEGCNNRVARQIYWQVRQIAVMRLFMEIHQALDHL